MSGSSGDGNGCISRSDGGVEAETEAAVGAVGAAVRAAVGAAVGAAAAVVVEVAVTVTVAATVAEWWKRWKRWENETSAAVTFLVEATLVMKNCRQQSKFCRDPLSVGFENLSVYLEN